MAEDYFDRFIANHTKIPGYVHWTKYVLGQFVNEEADDKVMAAFGLQYRISVDFMYAYSLGEELVRLTQGPFGRSFSEFTAISYGSDFHYYFKDEADAILVKLCVVDLAVK